MDELKCHDETMKRIMLLTVYFFLSKWQTVPISIIQPLSSAMEIRYVSWIFFKTTINITSTECEANKQNKQTNK